MTASASPKPDRRFRRRDAVVQTAVELINKKGVHGMTLAEVAARLGQDLTPFGAEIAGHGNEIAEFHALIAAHAGNRRPS